MKKYSFGVCFSLSLALISTSLQSAEHHEVKKSELAHRLNALRVEALTELDTQHYLKAEQLFAEILRLEPKTWLEESEYNEILLFLAQTELFLGKFGQAKHRFDQLLKEGMTKGVLYKREMIKAQILDREGNKQLALKTLNDLKEGFEINLWEISDQRYYLQLKSQIDHLIEERLKQATNCYESGHYQEALILFEDILNALEWGVYAPIGSNKLAYQIRIKVAFCCFHHNQYKKAQTQLLQAKELFPALFDMDSFYQLIMATKELDEPLKGLEYCKEFLSCGFAKSKQLIIKLEMGQFYFLLGECAKARAVFESLLNEIKEPSQLTCLKLKLAKIALDEKEFGKVINLIDDPLFDNCNHLVKVEKNRLKGIAYYHLGKYELAKESLKEALDLKEENFSKEQQQRLYFLGNSCFKLAQMASISNVIKENELHMAKEVFEKLHCQAPSDQTLLALARTLLLSEQLTNHVKGGSSFEKLCATASFESLEGELEMGLLQAEWETDSVKKAQIYQRLTSNKYEKGKNFGKAWYNQGVFYAQSPSILNPDQAKQNALESFIQSYHYLKRAFPKKACLAIKNWIQIQMGGQDPSLLTKVYQKLELLIEQDQELLNKNENLNGLRYLQAELCLKIFELIKDESYFKRGVETLDLCTCEEKVFSDQKLFLLAKLYKQNQNFARAKNYFLTLVERYPHFEKRAESLFELAECARYENADPNEVRGYLKKLYENNPDSVLAARAYLASYSDEEYLSELQEPFEHLKGMQQLFKTGPATIKGCYLLGVSYKNRAAKALKKNVQLELFQQSLDWLNRAKTSSLKALEASSIDLNVKDSLSHIYHQSMLMLGQVYLESANLLKESKRLGQIEKAIAHLQIVISKFEKGNEIEFSGIARAKLALGLAYGQKGLFDLSEKTLKELIESYHQYCIFNDSLLEKAFYELSQIAIAKGNFKEALEYLEQAELALTSQSQNEEIALQQSYCHRLLGQYEQAEIYLSKVINNGQSSKLQAKAMYLRAEIYTLQGKKDLAMKQLEMIVSQNNEWAKLAQAKLVKDYSRN